MSDNHQIAERLRTQLTELLGRANVIEANLRQPLDADFSDQAIDLADDEALAGVDDVLRGEIHDIRLALLRIENGSYGQCTSCGGPINPARLEALPTTGLCIACAG